MSSIHTRVSLWDLEIENHGDSSFNNTTANFGSRKPLCVYPGLGPAGGTRRQAALAPLLGPPWGQGGFSVHNFLWDHPFGDLTPHFDFAFWTKGEVSGGGRKAVKPTCG